MNAAVKRIQRLLQLAELLQSGRAYNASQLSTACHVSRRTIFRDLNMLQESGVHVAYDSERQVYSLPSKTFLPPTDFTVDEVLSLLILCHGLADESRGLPFQNPARSAALKLVSILPSHLRRYVGDVTDAVQIHLDPRNPLADDEKRSYELLLQSIAERRCARLVYQSVAEAAEIRTRLSPYRVLFSRRSWYVIGRSSLHRSIRTFNLSRIKDCELLDETYEIPARFSVERYLGNAWHLIREKDRSAKVVIRFAKKLAQNVAEVRWHATQQLDWNDDGSVNFTVQVDGLNEIMWWILGYGDQAEVLEPAELRAMVATRARSMLSLYAAEAGGTPISNPAPPSTGTS